MNIDSGKPRPINLNSVKPKDWLGGLKDHWRGDLLSSFSVAMVALPLALGIAIAAGAAPMTGLISVIIGGIVCTFFRGSAIAINGPGAGLISVIAAAIIALNDGTPNAYGYVLACFFIVGAIQVLLGLFKLGRLGSLFPSSVIIGIMAAIGVIIFSKQAHVTLGTSSDAHVAIDILLDIPRQLGHVNLYVLIVSAACMFILWYYPKVQNRLFHFIPAPMWVLIVSIILGLLLAFNSERVVSLAGHSFDVGPELLINVPSNLLESIVFPDFSKVGSIAFWISVATIATLAFIETLAMTKAVDRLDPHSRKTNLSKDLIGVGIGTMVSAALGGLPIITVIERSSVNVSNGGTTRWSNFFHGVIILFFVIVLAPVLRLVPHAALASILVFVGLKLAGPKVFKDSYLRGWEQLFIVLATLVVTLFSDLLVGVFAGFVTTFFLQMRKTGLGFMPFVKRAIKPKFYIKQKADKTYEARIRGIANFLTLSKIMKAIEALPQESQITVDFSRTRLVDATFLENIYEYARIHRMGGGTFYIIGLNKHESSSKHPFALKVLHSTIQDKLSTRQKNLRGLALKWNWDYQKELNFDASYLRNFHFFQSRPIEYKKNVISGSYLPYMDVNWEISDVTFDEGAMAGSEVHHTTLQVIQLPFRIPQFSLDKEGIFDRIFDQVLEFAGHKQINFKSHPKFSRMYYLQGRNEQSCRAFFTDAIMEYLEEEDIFHIESNGEALVIFKHDKLAKLKDVRKMLNFSYYFCKLIFKDTDFIPNAPDLPNKNGLLVDDETE